MINAVVDISHHNGNVNLAQAKSDGLIGVIQKATQGRSNIDPTYKTNRKKAGLLWGAYHFGTGSDGVKQADHFLNTVQPVGAIWPDCRCARELGNLDNVAIYGRRDWAGAAHRPRDWPLRSEPFQGG